LKTNDGDRRERLQEEIAGKAGQDVNDLWGIFSNLLQEC
jgi:hypothetical protein